MHDDLIVSREHGGFVKRCEQLESLLAAGRDSEIDCTDQRLKPLALRRDARFIRFDRCNIACPLAATLRRRFRQLSQAVSMQAVKHLFVERLFGFEWCGPGQSRSRSGLLRDDTCAKHE
jgi:hypothetical protein